MRYREMMMADIPMVCKLYIDYYNGCEGGMWSAETAERRIRQVLTRMDSFSMLCEDNGGLCAFAMGYFEQYDDGFAYDLVEIVVAANCQNRGLGTALMAELERCVHERGAMLVQLQSVNDARHEHFYGKLGYRDAKNLVLKTKML